MKDIERVFEGIRFSVDRYHFSKDSAKDAVVHPGSVVMIPLLDEDTVVLIRNERFAVGETLWELPAGTLEPGEPPEETAVRELREEIGFESSLVEPLLEFYTTPGYSTEKIIAYTAKELTKNEQQLDEGEKITVHPLSWSEVKELIKRGEIRDAKTLAALLYYLSSKSDSFS